MVGGASLAAASSSVACGISVGRRLVAVPHNEPQYGQAIGVSAGGGSSSNSAGSQVWPRGQRMEETVIKESPRIERSSLRTLIALVPMLRSGTRNGVLPIN